MQRRDVIVVILVIIFILLAAVLFAIYRYRKVLGNVIRYMHEREEEESYTYSA